MIKQPKLTGYMPPQPGYSHSSKQSIVNAVDPPIKEVIRDLLSNGFITASSCAGHVVPGEEPYISKGEYIQKGSKIPRTFYNMSGMGYIEFSKDGYNEKRIKQILTKHNLTGLKKINVIDAGKVHIVYLFNAIGMRHTKRHINAGGPEGAIWESA